MYGMEVSSPAFKGGYPNTDISIYAGQVDYTHPFGKKYKLEAG